MDNLTEQEAIAVLELALTMACRDMAEEDCNSSCSKAWKEDYINKAREELCL